MSRPLGSQFGNYTPPITSTTTNVWRKREIAPRTRLRMHIQSMMVLYPRGMTQSIPDYCAALADIVIEKGYTANRNGLASDIYEQLYAPLKR